VNIVVVVARHANQTNIQLSSALNAHAIVDVYLDRVRCPDGVNSVTVNWVVRVRVIQFRLLHKGEIENVNLAITLLFW
jgi:hypothetical protein